MNSIMMKKMEKRISAQWDSKPTLILSHLKFELFQGERVMDERNEMDIDLEDRSDENEDDDDDEEDNIHDMFEGLTSKRGFLSVVLYVGV